MRALDARLRSLGHPRVQIWGLSLVNFKLRFASNNSALSFSPHLPKLISSELFSIRRLRVSRRVIKRSIFSKDAIILRFVSFLGWRVNNRRIWRLMVWPFTMTGILLISRLRVIHKWRRTHSILMTSLVVLMVLMDLVILVGLMVSIQTRLMLLNKVGCMLRSHYFGLSWVVLLLLILLTFKLSLLLQLWHMVWLAERRFNIWGCLGGLLVKLAKLVSIDGGRWFTSWWQIIDYFVRHGRYLRESGHIQFVGLLVVRRWRRLILVRCIRMVLIKGGLLMKHVIVVHRVRAIWSLISGKHSKRDCLGDACRLRSILECFAKIVLIHLRRLQIRLLTWRQIELWNCWVHLSLPFSSLHLLKVYL